MSNELKEAAQQAVDAFDAFSDADDFISLFALTQKMRTLRTTIQQAEAQQPATPDLRIGVCITDGVLHAIVMQHESNGAITVVATAEIDAASLHGRDCIGRMKPATPEPGVSRNPFASRCYTMSESHLSGHRLIVGFEKLGDAQDAHEWVTRQGRGDFTHPAPSVPDGYALVPVEPTQAMLNVQTWDFNRFYSPREIWVAMLAAKDAK